MNPKCINCGQPVRRIVAGHSAGDLIHLDGYQSCRTGDDDVAELWPAPSDVAQSTLTPDEVRDLDVTLVVWHHNSPTKHRPPQDGPTRAQDKAWGPLLDGRSCGTLRAQSEELQRYYDRLGTPCEVTVASNGEHRFGTAITHDVRGYLIALGSEPWREVAA